MVHQGDLIQELARSMGIPMDYTEDYKLFSADASGNQVSSKELTELEGSVAWIVKDVELYMSGDTAADASFNIYEDSSGNAFGTRYYQTGSFLHFDGNENGKLKRALTMKPSINLFPGTNMLNQTIYGTIHYFFK